MSTYIIGDIHGHYNELMEMLEKIDFKKEDTLYLLGDLIDRGTNSLGVIDFVKNNSNVFSIKGNHEYLFEDFVEEGNSFLWARNGGRTTYHQLQLEPNLKEKIQELYAFTKSLPLTIVVGNNILVHAGLYIPNNYKELSVEELISLQDEEFCLQSRSNIDNEKEISGYNVICGHSITSMFFENNNGKIQKQNGHIYMDCGIIKTNGTLACLRLEDMEEFYIEKRY